MARIREWRTPRNYNEVQRFLGLVQYLAHFLPDITAYTAPLSPMMRNNTAFLWRPLLCPSTVVQVSGAITHYEVKKIRTGFLQTCTRHSTKAAGSPSASDNCGNPSASRSDTLFRRLTSKPPQRSRTRSSRSTRDRGNSWTWPTSEGVL